MGRDTLFGTTEKIPTLRESEMRRCICCFPIAQHTIVSLDPRGREQYTCPRTKITQRFFEGAQTYLGGQLGMHSLGGALVNSAGHPIVAAHTGVVAARPDLNRVVRG